MTVEKLVGCVIPDSNQNVLLIHRNTPALQEWEILGGKKEPGEKYSVAAEREAQEELGIKIGQLAYIGFTFFSTRQRNFVQVLFRAEILEGEPSPQEDMHDHADYFDLSKIDSISVRLSAGIHALNDSLRSGRIKL
jgi:8-oxo-dGTP diphosphatase